MEGGFPSKNHARTCDPAHSRRDRVGITHGLAAGGSEKWHVRSYVQLGPVPDRPHGSLDVFHAAVGMPSNVDGIDTVTIFVAGENRLHSRLCQRLSNTGSPYHENS